jgi:hypothetical protein
MKAVHRHRGTLYTFLATTGGKKKNNYFFIGEWAEEKVAKVTKGAKGGSGGLDYEVEERETIRNEVETCPGRD